MAGFGEKDGFARWLELVKAEAAKHGRVFAMWSEEMPARDDARYNDGLEVAELSGWLLTPEEAEQHRDLLGEIVFDFDTIEPTPDAVRIRWSMEGNDLKIRFDLWKDDDYTPMWE